MRFRFSRQHFWKCRDRFLSIFRDATTSVKIGKPDSPRHSQTIHDAKFPNRTIVWKNIFSDVASCIIVVSQQKLDPMKAGRNECCRE